MSSYRPFFAKYSTQRKARNKKSTGAAFPCTFMFSVVQLYVYISEEILVLNYNPKKYQQHNVGLLSSSCRNGSSCETACDWGSVKNKIVVFLESRWYCFFG